MAPKMLPTDESSFFQRIKEDTLGSIFWERLELRTDSGFPDTHFAFRPPVPYTCEGTVEFKFCKTRIPNLGTLMKPTQKANFIEYAEAGGRRRFLLCCNGIGEVFFYITEVVVLTLLSPDTHRWSRSHLDGIELPLTRNVLLNSLR